MFGVILGNGTYVALISDEDYNRVIKYKWYAHFSKGSNRKTGQPYARATIKGKKVYLHRFIAKPKKGQHTDHRNHQTLDCRRQNLENVTPSENLKRRRVKTCSK